MVLAVVLGVVATGAGWAQTSGPGKTETLLRWNFAGTKQLATLKDLKTMQEVLNLPETRALGETMADTFAHAAAGRFGKEGGTNAATGNARLIQPLLPDVWQSESRFQMFARGAQGADWMLALKVPPARSDEWSKALSDLATRSGLQRGAGDGKGWTAEKENYHLTFSRSKDWTIIQGGSGAPDAKVSKEFRSALDKRRSKNVLEAEVNTPRLAEVLGARKLAHVPRLTLTAAPKKASLYSELIIEYPEDLGIKAEKWNVPTELIREPLVGFTAIQGVRAKLGEISKVRELAPQETPNQLFLWTHSHPPFSVLLAADVKNPAAVVGNAARLLQGVNLPQGKLVQPTNRAALVWAGLPIAAPFLEVGEAPNASFLVAGLFSFQRRGDVPLAPPALFEQLKKKNVVYYDWEITGERLRQWIPLWQLRYLVGSSLTPNVVATSSTWLQAVKSRMGNTVTAGTLESPRKLKLVRQSDLGFTALELLLLAHGVDRNDLSAVMRRTSPAPAVNAPALP